MIGDLARGAAVEASQKSRFFGRICVNLNSELVDEGQYPWNNQDIRFTDFVGYVLYKPSHKYKYRNKPFQFINDMYDTRAVRVSGFEELSELAKSDKLTAWWFKWANISDLVFKAAEKNVQVRIPVCIDVGKYNEMLTEKYRAKYGKEPDGSLLNPPELDELENERFKVYLNTLYKKYRGGNAPCN